MKTKILLTILFASLVWQANAQEFETPQWEMPLCFEDATGQRDTVWIGYDPRAGVYGGDIDVIFDEDYKSIDTSKFNVFLYRGWSSETGYLNHARKRKIGSWPLAISGDLGFIHGKLPVTMKWDASLLNSPNLPEFYPEISPRPKARIDLISENYIYNMTECNPHTDGYPDAVLTDYVVEFEGCECVFSDDLIFQNIWTNFINIDEVSNDPFLIIFERHDYNPWSSAITDIYNEISIFPNPVVDILNIKSLKFEELSFTLFNIEGQLLYAECTKNNEIQLDLSNYSSGLYIIKIMREGKLLTYKINKQ